MNLGVVILAAGASLRMGRPKLLLPWSGGTVLEHLLGQWRRLAPAQLAVVCAPAQARDSLHAELDRLGCCEDARILNPNPARGMFSSIRCAAQWTGWTAGLTHWAIALGDQPLVRWQTLQRVLEFAATHPDRVCQPSRQGHGRHPVILPANIFAELKTTTSAHLKEFLVRDARPVARLEIDDPGLDLDLDVQADYEQALAQADRA